MKSTGKLLLDSYYNLNKLQPSLVDIEKFTPYLECSNFMLQKMFCFKQRLYNSNKKNTVALKPHMILHFPSFIIYYGCIQNFDSAVVEAMHKTMAKLPYKQSSRRSDHLLEEMSSRIDLVQLTRILVDKNIKNDREAAPLRQELTVKYITQPPESVIFEGMKSIYYRIKLNYQRNNETVHTNYFQNISFHTNFHTIWKLVCELDYTSTRQVVNAIKAGLKGIY
jgi:hypothetical protein